MLTDKTAILVARTLAYACSILLTAGAMFSNAQQPATTVDTPRHVILIIGDGMDDQQISIARNYLVGAAGRLSIDNMALRSSSQILTIENRFSKHGHHHGQRCHYQSRAYRHHSG